MRRQGVDQQYVSGTGFPHASYRAFSLERTSLIFLTFSKRSCCFQSSKSILSSSDESRYSLLRRLPSQVFQCSSFFRATSVRDVEILQRASQKSQRKNRVCFRHMCSLQQCRQLDVHWRMGALEGGFCSLEMGGRGCAYSSNLTSLKPSTGLQVSMRADLAKGHESPCRLMSALLYWFDATCWVIDTT